MVEKLETVLNWAATEALVTRSIRDAGQFCKRYVESVVIITSSRQILKYAACKMHCQLSGWTTEAELFCEFEPCGCVDEAACCVFDGTTVAAGVEFVTGCARATEHKTLVSTRMGAKRHFIFAWRQVKSAFIWF